MAKFASRSIREFLKGKKSQREDATKLQQRGNASQEFNQSVSSIDKELTESEPSAAAKNGAAAKGAKTKEKEDKERIQKVEKEKQMEQEYRERQREMQDRKEDGPDKDKGPEKEPAVQQEEARRQAKGHKQERDKEEDRGHGPQKAMAQKAQNVHAGIQSQQHASRILERDMMDEARGQLDGVPGSPADPGEAAAMAQNGIRDADELVTESLLNEGYTAQEADEIRDTMAVMDGYLHGGGSQAGIAQLNNGHEMYIVAKAYVETVKDSTRSDLRGLEKISEICQFDHPAYENVFSRTPGSEVMEKLEMEMGRERE